MPESVPLIRRTLAFRPPYDWHAILSYLAGRATPGVELVTAEHGGCYRRTVRLGSAAGAIAVFAAPDSTALLLEITPSLHAVDDALVVRLRRLLDLDAEPRVIGACLAADPTLAPLIAARPGLRVPGAVDGFELALRTVLGQQVSVRGATTLAGRLVALLGDPIDAAPLTHLPVTPERLADAGAERVASIGLPRARAEAIVGLARAVASGELPELASETPVADPAAFMVRFTALRGIGPWTTSYVTMRALGWPDAFPEGDLGLRKAAGGVSAAQLRATAERWRPWRSYAAHHLWASLAQSPGAAGMSRSA